MPIVLALAPVLLQLLAKFFPVGGTVATITGEVAAVLPNLISAGQTEIQLATSGAPPTAAQQAAIDAALDQANALLQAAQPSV